MARGQATPSESDSLRDQAEKSFTKRSDGVATLSSDSAQGLAHDLEVHQIELETQNEELRRVQLELENSRDDYLDLYDFAPVGYVTLDSKGVILRANLAAARMLGEKRNQLHNTNLTLYISHEDQDTLHRHLREVFRGGALSPIELDLRAHVDNSRTRVLVTSESSAGQRLAGECRMVFLDITERKRAAEDRDAIMELSGDLICIASTNGDFKCVNPAMEHTLGYTAQELLARPFMDFIHPDDHAKADAELERLKSGERAMDFEFRCIAKDGSVRDVSWSVTPRHNTDLIYCVGRDITDRKRADEALEEQRNLMHAVIEGTEDSVFVKDRDGRYLLMNSADAAGLGRLPEEVIGLTDADLWPPEMAARISARDREVIAQGVIQSYEEEYVHTNGETRMCLVTKYPRFSADGKVAGVIGIAHDVTEQKQAAEALRRERDRAKVYLDVAGAIMLALDAEGRISLLNRKGSEVLGVSQEDALGQSWFDRFLPERDRQIAEQGFADVIAERLELAEYSEKAVLNAQGEERLIAWRNTLVRNHNGAVIGTLSSGEDITERRRAEDSLRDKDERLRTALAAAEMGTWCWEAGSDRDTRDAGLNRILGLEARETTQSANDFFDRVHPEDRARAREEFERAIAQQDTYAGDFRIVRPDGEVRWIHDRGVPFYDEQGELVRVTGAIVDITNRRNTENELRESEERYRSIVDNIGIGVAVVNPDMEILDLNRQMRNWFPHIDTDQRPTCYRSFNDPPGDAICSYCPTIKTLKYGQVHEGETATPHPDGVRHYRIVASPLFDDQGAVAAAIEMTEDITEQKRSKEELIQHRDHLEELVQKRTQELEDAYGKLMAQDRLATLGRLTAMVSHELRNPLGAIWASFFAIAEETRDRGLGIESVLDRAERNIVRCDKIIEELLDYAREARLELSQTRIDEWLAHVLDEQTIGAEISVTRALESGATIAIDREKLRRCVVNLLSNSCQSLEEGQPEGGRVTVQTVVSDSRLEIRVIDNGPGISPDQMKKIFEPLHSTKGFGVGLGLPIVKRIMDAHKGGIEIESKQGQVTTATLWLPLRTPEGTPDEQVSYSRGE